jgi:uncharacterized membrane protein
MITLSAIAEQTRSPEQRRVVHRQGYMILHSSQDVLQEEDDTKDVQEEYQRLLDVLNSFEDSDGPYSMKA